MSGNFARNCSVFFCA